MPELRDALREATNKLGVLAGNPQLIAFDAMLTSYPTLTVAGAIGFGVNPANAFAGAAATIEVIANGANVPTFAGITATGSYVNTAGAVNRIEFECLPSGPGSALAFYAKIGNGGGAAPVTSVAGRTGAVILDKGDVGLGAVDNTADADKPISSATASALNSRESTAARALTPTDTDPGNSATINGFLSWLISAARSAQTTLSELGSLAFKSTIASADITDGAIMDADISPSAAISISKVSGLQTAINSKQPTDPTLQSIADSTATGLIQRNANETVTLLPTGAMAGPLLAAGDAEAVRGVAGCGTMAVQNANAVALAGQADLGGFAHNNFYFANALFSNSTGGIGVFVDRLQAADRRFAITPAGDYSGLFDASYESGTNFGGGGVSTSFEVDFREPGASYAYIYSGGFFAFHFFDYFPEAYLTPLSIKIEMYQVGPGGTTGVWLELATLYPTDNSTATQNKVATVGNPSWPPFLAKLRFTINTRPNAASTIITKIEYFAARPETSESPQYLLTGAGGSQVVDCPAVRFGKAANNLSISPGTISINNAPAITWHNSAIVPANGAVQDYTLTGLALNDFCQCSTGKPAQAVDIGGGVIRLRTDTTGFTGNVKIFAIRTN